MTPKTRLPKAKAPKAKVKVRLANLRSGGTVGRFRSLVQAYYEESFERFPEHATEAGEHALDSELGKPTPATWERQTKLMRRTIEAVEDLPPQDFDAEATLDRRAFLAGLRTDLLEAGPLRRWANNPRQHLFSAADSIHNLFIRHADDLAPVAEAMIARLKKIPAYLDAAAEGLALPEPRWQELTERDAQGVVGFFDSLPEPLARAGGRPVAGLRALAKKAGDAAKSYAKHVAKLKPGAAGSFAVGEERLQWLIQERLGLRYSPRELTTVARLLIADLKDAMTQEARCFHPKKSAAEILHEASMEWNPGTSLVQTYQEAMTRIRARFEEAGWVTFPKGDRLLVKGVPEFMRGQFPTAAYSAPGPLDPDQTGIFWVNDLTGGEGNEAQRRAERAQHFGVELTSAHEGYPGHHLQFITQNRHPALSRKLAHHAIYYEGWTLWCEQMLADLEVAASPYLRLQQMSDALWRGWRIVIDVGLQCGTMTIDQAVKLLMREMGFTKARAQGEIDWYTAQPAVPMAYLLGKMELLRLKKQRVDSGGMTLREFNDWVLSFGAIPWRWIEESGL